VSPRRRQGRRLPLPASCCVGRGVHHRDHRQQCQPYRREQWKPRGTQPHEPPVTTKAFGSLSAIPLESFWAIRRLDASGDDYPQVEIRCERRAAGPPTGRTSLVVANARAVGNKESGMFVYFMRPNGSRGFARCRWQIDHCGKQHRCAAVKIPNVQSIDTERVIAKISRSLCRTPRESDPRPAGRRRGSRTRGHGILANGANHRSTNIRRSLPPLGSIGESPSEYLSSMSTTVLPPERTRISTARPRRRLGPRL
jgi:hypothetical protein